MINFDSDSSNSDMDYWENELVYLQPKQEWNKPLFKTCYLTNSSITVKPEIAEEVHGILQCFMNGILITLCSLYARKPSQKMCVVWPSGKSIRLVNTGNFPITLSILVKKMSV